MAVLHSTWLYWYSNGSTSLYHGSASLCLTVLQSTSLYHDSTSLYLTLLNTNMAILHSTCLYHGSILQFPWLWFTLPSLHSTWLYVTLPDSNSFCLGTTSFYTLLHLIWLYSILPWIYLTLVDSSLFCHSSTSLYLTLLHSTVTLHHSLWLDFIPQ